MDGMLVLLNRQVMNQTMFNLASADWDGLLEYVTGCLEGGCRAAVQHPDWPRLKSLLTHQRRRIQLLRRTARELEVLERSAPPSPTDDEYLRMVMRIPKAPPLQEPPHDWIND